MTLPDRAKKPKTQVFSKIEGWNDAFEQHFCLPSNNLNLDAFLTRLEKEKLMDEFIKIFGLQRLEELKNPFLRNLSLVKWLVISGKDALINFANTVNC